MGANLMATRNRNGVIETAIETVGRQLREPGVRELLRDLPAGRAAQARAARRPAGNVAPDRRAGVSSRSAGKAS